MQVPLVQQRTACRSRGIVFSLGARLRPSFSKKIFLGDVEVFKRPILNEELDIVGDADGKLQPKFPCMLLVVPALNGRECYGTPRASYILQSFIPYITQFPSTDFRDTSLYEMGKALPLSKVWKSDEGGCIQQK